VAIGSRWRKLDCPGQALLVLVHLRKGETFAQVAAGFGVGTATAWRYVNEVVPLLAARAPRLRQAVRAARGHAHVVLDGTLIAIDRVAADRPSYSGKHKHHGMNLQVIASPRGDVLWVSGSLPGSVHDMKADLPAEETARHQRERVIKPGQQPGRLNIAYPGQRHPGNLSSNTPEASQRWAAPLLVQPPTVTSGNACLRRHHHRPPSAKITICGWSTSPP
jgi:hypothetical protein